MRVIKANGGSEEFDEQKVRASLARVGTPRKIQDQVLRVVIDRIYDGLTTDSLYRMVFDELKKLQGGFAGKYNLKKALIELGPSGYPFEDYIGRLWESKGFSVEIGTTLKGFCVSHEVDVNARIGDLVQFVECKHHSSQKNYCTVRNPLYFFARFLDLQKQYTKGSKDSPKCEGCLVTNTRFTSEAMAYGKCVGLGLVSWDHPKGNSLREQIDRSGLHPVTCLSLLSNRLKRALIDRGIVLCMDICESPGVLLEVGLNRAKAEKVLKEGAAVCGLPASSFAG